jgi:hypothetical protein
MPARVSVRSVLSRPGIVTKPLLLHTSRRPFSSTESTSQKQQVKLTSQDNKSGRRWAELSKGQKVIRTASTGANFLTIVVGVVLTVGRSRISCCSGLRIDYFCREPFSLFCTQKFSLQTPLQIGSIVFTAELRRIHAVQSC